MKNMKVITICLKNDLDLSRVCSILGAKNYDIDACVGRYVLDAKSALGFMTLGFGKAVDIVAHTEDIDQIDELCQELMPWKA